METKKLMNKRDLKEKKKALRAEKAEKEAILLAAKQKAE